LMWLSCIFGCTNNVCIIFVFYYGAVVTK
jgi:hypothetical protein